MTNQKIVDKTSSVLNENKSKWEDVYAKHIEIINKNAEHAKLSDYCQINSPLALYSSISKAKSEDVLYDLRFAGKSVGTITLKEKSKKEKELEKDKRSGQYKAILSFSDGQLNVVKKLGFDIPPKKEEWNSKNARNFRSKLQNKFRYGISAKQLKDYFKGGKIGEEARLECLILNELKKGKIPNITPILLDKAFYQLTTPLAASNHYEEPRMTTNKNYRGGGIDIFARITHGSNRYGNRLAVIELKDANKKSKAKNAEPQSVVIQQAIEYATFLAHLLCSKRGDDWWNNFRDRDKQKNQLSVPPELHIDAISLMPEGDSEEGDLKTVLEVKGLGKKIYIHPYSLYFKKDNDGNPIGFYGTLIDEIG